MLGWSYITVGGAWTLILGGTTRGWDRMPAVVMFVWFLAVLLLFGWGALLRAHALVSRSRRRKRMNGT